MPNRLLASLERSILETEHARILGNVLDDLGEDVPDWTQRDVPSVVLHGLPLGDQDVLPWNRSPERQTRTCRLLALRSEAGDHRRSIHSSQRRAGARL